MPREVGNIKMYPLSELAEQIGVSTYTLREYCKSGRLKAQILGGSWMVSEENLKVFLNAASSSPKRGKKKAIG